MILLSSPHHTISRSSESIKLEVISTSEELEESLSAESAVVLRILLMERLENDSVSDPAAS